MDVSERLMGALTTLQEVADSLGSVDEARAAIDAATLQTFWRDWPHVSGWAGALWRSLSEEIADAAVPAEQAEHHDTGGEGG